MEADDFLYYRIRIVALLWGKVFMFEGCPCSQAAWGFSRNLKHKGGGFKTQRKKEMREIIKMGINLCFVGGSLKMRLEICCQI